MIVPPLTYYSKQFCSLRVDRSKGAPAPHKPILLLAVIEGIATGEIQENKIYITPELVAKFKDYWSLLVNDPRFTPNFALPFYHLQQKDPGRSFWNLVVKTGKKIITTSSNSIRSFVHLLEVIDYAEIDYTLFCLLSDIKEREILKSIILKHWFSRTKTPNVNAPTFELLKAQVLNQRAVEQVYEQALAEEIAFVRSAIFKKEVPKIYNYRCAISGMRIIADRNIQMVDACHIIPFSETGDDTITNGLSLCPNLHRAFDRGLISIDDDYCLLTSSFAEAESIYEIKPLVGNRIILPSEKQHWPHPEKLLAHRTKFGLN